jgi:asparagine synthase (glutamine-hydrolysing)
MCGLAGICSLRGAAPPERAELIAMLGLLGHRGPDFRGLHLEPLVGLAHARLSIIDVAGGAQPMSNQRQDIWLCFNGEIFNFIELRAELERQGHVFRSHSDTEVIVHLYERYGEDFVQRLNGQFAIALWDGRQQRLLLVRDRVGNQPLFYAWQDRRLLFASEVKALLAVIPQAPSLNPKALDQITTFWSPVGAETIFSGVSQLCPGEMLTWDEQGLKRSRYWDWAFPTDGVYRPGSEQALAEELHDLLLDATRLRLRADVPVGAYLSGGLDSSVLTSLIHTTGVPLRTFSIGFEDEGLDESAYQRLMVNHLGARHSRIQCTAADVGRAFEEALWHAEVPVLRTAPVPMLLLSRLVREQGYKVVLTGEGADEVLGGYDLFKEAKIRRFWARYPQSRLRPLLLKRLYPYLDLSSGSGQAYLEAFFGIGLSQPEQPFFSHLPRWSTTAGCKVFFAEDFQAQLAGDVTAAMGDELPGQFAAWHGFNRAQYLEAKTLMAGYLLSSQGDRMLMANSVEGRFPFLDHRVIEFANGLHPKLKMKVLNEKYLLKRAMRSRLPGQILARHKQPYRAPDVPAFFNHGGPDYIDDLLSAERLVRYGYFDAAKVSRLLAKIRRGQVVSYKDNMAFVLVLSTQLWHNLFVENFHSKIRNAVNKAQYVENI